jgi:hypothetical protein
LDSGVPAAVADIRSLAGSTISRVLLEYAMSVSTPAAGDFPVASAYRSVYEGRRFEGDVSVHWRRLLDALDGDGASVEPGLLAALEFLSQLTLGPPIADAVASSDQAALSKCLSVEVPLWISKANTGIQPDDGLLMAWRNRAGVALQRADDMVFGSKRRAEAATLLVDLARGIAALAYRSGGVAFAGMIFCAEHSPDGAIATDDTGQCGLCRSAEWRDEGDPTIHGKAGR